ncbi:TBC1 domain family member 16-like [Bolinopsis microptera]|uniref:TBC1 domain family member 16-like n=1 Tax=Bolinopsis microptera TaxID=2820187 RepID=UPI0030799EE8
MGYVQGMSDLLVPLFIVVREESEVFWCFDFFMNRSAFSKLQYCNLYQQLAFLREVLGLLFPDIYSYLSTTGDALTLTCCHRWFLLFFKREFDLNPLLKLWDVMLAAPSPFFQVFISAAMISLRFPNLIAQHLSATELLMESQKLAGTFDLDKVLVQARRIYLELIGLPEVPCSLMPLVGGEGDYWDGYRNPNFSCLDCDKKGFCEMKRDYHRVL